MARRFASTIETTDKELLATLDRMGVEEHEIEGNFKPRRVRSGKGYVEAPPYGPVTIRFVRKGKPYEFRCDTYEDARDNYRAAQRAISGLYQIHEDYKVTTGAGAGGDGIDRVFAGFLALPDGGERPWWDVLGVPPSATAEAIEAAYVALARKHHPDRPGGDEATMARLNLARAAGLAERAQAFHERTRGER